MNVKRLTLLPILLLAAWLRWQQLDLVDYAYDEAHIVGMAQGVVASGGSSLPLLSGGTSLGIQRGALDVYLLALPLAITGGRIEAAVWLLGALGTLAVALTYQIGQRIASSLTPLLSHPLTPSPPHPSPLATVATLYMAANPWLVYYDRKLWAHIQVVFSVLLFYLAWQVVVEQKKRAAFWFPVVAALQLLSHTLALVQALCWLAALLCAPRRWLCWQMAAGTLVAGLLLTPYLFATWQRVEERGLEPSSAFKQLFATSAESTTEDAKRENATNTPSAENVAWLFARQLLSGSGLSSVIGMTEYENLWWRLGRIVGMPIVLGLIGLGMFRLVLTGVSHLFSPLAPRSLLPRSLLLLTWAIGPVLLFGLASTNVYLQYWTVLLPIPALWFAIGSDTLIGWFAYAMPTTFVSPNFASPNFLKHHPSLLTLFTLLLTFLLALLWGVSYQGVLIQRSQLGGSLRAWQQAMQVVRQQAHQADTQEVRVAVDGVDPGYQSEPAVVASLIGNPPFARFVAPTSPPSILLSDQRPSLYFWALGKGDFEQALAQGGKVIWQGNPIQGEIDARLYQLPAFSQANWPYQPIQPRPVFDVGMELVGYRFPEEASADQPLIVTLLWHVLQPPDSVRQRDMTAFNHLLAQDEQIAGQIDGLALLSRDWWPDDLLIQRYTMQLPAGEYRWRTGLYSRSDGGRAITTDWQDHVDIPGLLVR